MNGCRMAGRLLAACVRIQDRAVGRNLTPAENTEIEVAAKTKEDRLPLLKLGGIVRLEEDITSCVLARPIYRAAFRLKK